MKKLFLQILSSLAFLSLLFPLSPARAQVSVVDMIPNSQSGETFNNTEPYLAVNPNGSALTLAATAFEVNSGSTTLGALWVSYDGGNTWAENNILPSAASNYNTGDITIHYPNLGDNLYAGILFSGVYLQEQILRGTDAALTAPMTTLYTSSDERDQPYTYARTVLGWYDPGKERVWVGDHTGSSPSEAEVNESMDAASAAPPVSVFQIDPDNPGKTDSYQTRPVACADGHVYAAYYRREGSITGGYSQDVVVVRDDNWGQGATPFQSLLDSVTHVAGQNVTLGVPVTIDFTGAFGNEIIGGDLFLTVDPNNSQNVFISYADANGSEMTLHLKESNDSGQTWPATDLLTVSNAKNAAIAVNSQGKIGYLYQQLTGSSPNRHWQTHLRRSPDGVAWDNTTLSDFPAEGTGYPGGSRIIGDYEDLVAVGKNFYGVFSADNDLVNASFPSGVSFQRNHNATQFLANDNSTPVAASIDPFFFKTTEIDPSQDFYVRDWTDSPGSHDQGQEPSTHADFFSTGDVWNMRTDGPTAFNGNDQPVYQDPQPMSMGTNYAFARVNRGTTGTSAAVSVDFLYSDGGVGVNYVDAGTTILNFAPGDSELTLPNGLPWSLPSGASDHVCLAVQISTATDPYIQPGLAGHAPGWPNTDLWIVNDNNKAQRNMQVYGYGGMTGQSMSAYFLAHNAAFVTRNLVVGVDIDPALQSRLVGSLVARVIGGSRPVTQLLKLHGTLTLPAVAPGDNRSIEVTANLKAGPASDPLPIRFYELVNGNPLNGYYLAFQSLKPEEVNRQILAQHVAVFSRLAGLQGSTEVPVHVQSAQGLLRGTKIAKADYRKFLSASLPAIRESVMGYLKADVNAKDEFGITRALASLAKPTAGANDHLNLLNKLDAQITLRQKQQGDLSDILQMVEWQVADYSGDAQLKGQPFAAKVLEESQGFIRGFRGNRDLASRYVSLLKNLVSDFSATAEALPDSKDKLEAALAEIQGSFGSPTALEKAHRDFLLALPAPTGPAPTRFLAQK